MKRVFAIILTFCLLLSGCQAALTPADAGSPAWAPEEWQRLSYEEFFSRPRAAGENNAWTAPGGTFHVAKTEAGLQVLSEKGEAVYTVPDSAGLTGENWASNGVAAYCATGTEVLEVELLTGKTKTLFTGENVRELTLAARDAVFFIASAGEDMAVYRLYLPEERLDTVKTVPGYNIYWLHCRVLDTTLVETTYMNPEFYPKFERSHAEPDSMELIAEPPEETQNDFLACWALQFGSEKRPLLRSRLDTRTGEETVELGVIDNCWFGEKDLSHDHFSPDAKNYSPWDYGWPMTYDNSGLSIEPEIHSMTAEELENYQLLFTQISAPYGRQPGNYYAAALGCTFTSPEELDLTRFFAWGFPEEGTADHVERYLLGEEDTVWLRLPAERVAEVLDRYLGLTEAKGLRYLEETDCYYLPLTPSEEAPAPEFTAGDYNPQTGVVRLFYTRDGQEMVFSMRTLRYESRTGYRFLSNTEAR